MNPRLLHYYNRELRYIREMGGEFAKEFPKIAGRLGIEGIECADPYVERLLEGFAFLAARIQLKLDADFPLFTQHLLEMVYPHYLAPTPSMAVVQWQPDFSQASLADGFVVPRDSVLRSLLGKGDQTPCEYRTAHDVTLWPLEVAAAEYLPSAGALGAQGLPVIRGARAGIRLRLRTSAGLTFDQLALDRLPLFLRGSEQLPVQIYEQMAGNAVATVVRPAQSPAPWYEIVEHQPIETLGFDDQQALFPYGRRSFQGYRLLQEYFAFPERFLFVELRGLQRAVRRCTQTELEVVVLLDRVNLALEHVLGASHFGLFCTPAINLFPKPVDRIHLTEHLHEFHVLPDRTRPMDFEVYQVTGVTGFGTRATTERAFKPFYTAKHRTLDDTDAAFYSVYREPRRLSQKQQRDGARSSYIGSEVYVSLVDGREVPYSSDLRQIGVDALCTNRDLPLHMPVGQGRTDFTLEISAPVREEIRCVAGPTVPRPSRAHGDTAWQLISHLSLNYLSLMDTHGGKSVDALREILALYGDVSEAPIRKQIEGIRSLSVTPAVRRLPSPGPITVGRGLQITVHCDETAFEGTGVFLLGAVLEGFFARYVTINSFTETLMTTEQRREIMRWPIRMGRRHLF